MEKRSVEKTDAIVIVVLDGSVSDVHNLPKGVKLEVWDYDGENYEEDDLEIDSDGDEFNCSYYSED